MDLPHHDKVATPSKKAVAHVRTFDHVAFTFKSITRQNAESKIPSRLILNLQLLNLSLNLVVIDPTYCSPQILHVIKSITLHELQLLFMRRVAGVEIWAHFFFYLLCAALLVFYQYPLHHAHSVQCYVDSTLRGSQKCDSCLSQFTYTIFHIFIYFNIIDISPVILVICLAHFRN